MWIREPKGLGQSLGGNLNFLWKDPKYKVYIMDNHLAALWCWLDSLQLDDDYSLLHIDQHWDLAEMNEGEIEILKKENLKDINHFTSLRCGVREDLALVGWHNYITPLPHLRPNLKKAFLAAEANQNPPTFNDRRFELITIESFFSNLNERISNLPAGKILFNIDFDFFLQRMNYRVIRAYPDSYLDNLTEAIKPILDDVILTIAWSPEMCGGYKPVADVCKTFCEVLSITCPSTEPELNKYL